MFPTWYKRLESEDPFSGTEPIAHSKKKTSKSLKYVAVIFVLAVAGMISVPLFRSNIDSTLDKQIEGSFNRWSGDLSQVNSAEKVKQTNDVAVEERDDSELLGLEVPYKMRDHAVERRGATPNMKCDGGKCTCQNGWTGSNCTVAPCTMGTDYSTCSGSGICNHNGDGYQPATHCVKGTSCAIAKGTDKKALQKVYDQLCKKVNCAIFEGSGAFHDSNYFDLNFKTSRAMNMYLNEQSKGDAEKMRSDCEKDPILEGQCSICEDGDRCTVPIDPSIKSICLCDNGEIGPTCSEANCGALTSTIDGVVCSGNGRCVGVNVCECNDQFFGPRCERNACRPNMHLAECYGRGTCALEREDKEGPGCECDYPFYGHYCADNLCPSSNGAVCSGNGYCVQKDTCECLPGYSGSECHLENSYLLPSITEIADIVLLEINDMKFKDDVAIWSDERYIFKNMQLAYSQLNEGTLKLDESKHQTDLVLSGVIFEFQSYVTHQKRSESGGPEDKIGLVAAAIEIKTVSVTMTLDGDIEIKRVDVNPDILVYEINIQSDLLVHVIKQVVKKQIGEIQRNLKEDLNKLLTLKSLSHFLNSFLRSRYPIGVQAFEKSKKLLFARMKNLSLQANTVHLKSISISRNNIILNLRPSAAWMNVGFEYGIAPEYRILKEGAGQVQYEGAVIDLTLKPAYDSKRRMYLYASGARFRSDTSMLSLVSGNEIILNFLAENFEEDLKFASQESFKNFVSSIFGGCPYGKHGKNCELNACMDSVNEAVPCNGRGTCNMDTMQCDCIGSFYGDHCEKVGCAGPGMTEPCNGLGTCVDGECHCKEGYGGAFCSNHLCKGYGDLGICSGNGECAGEGLCNCDSGWGGMQCENKLPLFWNEVDFYIKDLLFDMAKTPVDSMNLNGVILKDFKWSVISFDSTQVVPERKFMGVHVNEFSLAIQMKMVVTAGDVTAIGDCMYTVNDSDLLMYFHLNNYAIVKEIRADFHKGFVTCKQVDDALSVREVTKALFAKSSKVVEQDFPAQLETAMEEALAKVSASKTLNERFVKYVNRKHILPIQLEDKVISKIGMFCELNNAKIEKVGVGDLVLSSIEHGVSIHAKEVRASGIFDYRHGFTSKHTQTNGPGTFEVSMELILRVAMSSVPRGEISNSDGFTELKPGDQFVSLPQYAADGSRFTYVTEMSLMQVQIDVINVDIQLGKDPFGELANTAIRILKPLLKAMMRVDIRNFLYYRIFGGCFEGRHGPNCDIPRCYQYANRKDMLTFVGVDEKPKICSHHGRCNIETKMCECMGMYTGLYCEKARGCAASSLADVCSGNGKCVLTDDKISGKCECRNGWAGEYCEIGVCGQTDSTPHCGGHGTCVYDKKFEAHKCHCDNGFTGEMCKEQLCKADFMTLVATNNYLPCSGYGKCIGKNNCVCNQGWAGPNCGYREKLEFDLAVKMVDIFLNKLSYGIKKISTGFAMVTDMDISSIVASQVIPFFANNNKASLRIISDTPIEFAFNIRLNFGIDEAGEQNFDYLEFFQVSKVTEILQTLDFTRSDEDKKKWDVEDFTSIDVVTLVEKMKGCVKGSVYGHLDDYELRLDGIDLSDRVSVGYADIHFAAENLHLKVSDDSCEIVKMHEKAIHQRFRQILNEAARTYVPQINTKWSTVMNEVTRTDNLFPLRLPDYTRRYSLSDIDFIVTQLVVQGMSVEKFEFGSISSAVKLSYKNFRSQGTFDWEVLYNPKSEYMKFLVDYSETGSGTFDITGMNANLYFTIDTALNQMHLLDVTADSSNIDVKLNYMDLKAEKVEKLENTLEQHLQHHMADHFERTTKAYFGACGKGKHGPNCNGPAQCGRSSCMPACRATGGILTATCSSHGFCNREYHSCECNEGWSGAFCQDKNKCGGRSFLGFHLSPYCSGRGECTEDGCRCRYGYSGPYCEVESCGKDALCNKHGSCLSVQGADARNASTETEYCQCNNGYGGKACEKLYCGALVVGGRLLGKPCGGNGYCLGEDGKCECDEGFDGQFCEKKVAPRVEAAHPFVNDLINDAFTQHNYASGPFSSLELSDFEYETLVLGDIQKNSIPVVLDVIRYKFKADSPSSGFCTGSVSKSEMEFEMKFVGYNINIEKLALSPGGIDISCDKGAPPDGSEKLVVQAFIDSILKKDWPQSEVVNSIAANELKYMKFPKHKYCVSVFCKTVKNMSIQDVSIGSAMIVTSPYNIAIEINHLRLSAAYGLDGVEESVKADEGSVSMKLMVESNRWVKRTQFNLNAFSFNLGPITDVGDEGGDWLGFKKTWVTSLVESQVTRNVFSKFQGCTRGMHGVNCNYPVCKFPPAKYNNKASPPDISVLGWTFIPYCSGKGTCNSNYVCDCTDGSTGAYCENGGSE
eukprot:Nk52_evm92s1073 gene=Nk52_evmTU92s1073